MQNKSGSEDMTEQVRSRAEKIAETVLADLVDKLGISCPLGTTADLAALLTGELADFRRQVLREVLSTAPRNHVFGHDCIFKDDIERLSEGGE